MDNIIIKLRKGIWKPEISLTWEKNRDTSVGLINCHQLC